MVRPVVLSYFSQSNDPGDPYLKALQEENRCLQRTWEDFNLSGNVNIDFLPRTNTEIENIEEDIRNYKHRILIFHYSGHAGNEQLIFPNGNSNVKGLAGLLGEAQNLKLVFLNGCATYDQVNSLFNKNVNVVVATKGQVSDKVAKEFATVFYEAITTREYTIEGAFKHAVHSLITNKKIPADTAAEPKLWRGFIVEQDVNKDLWELYAKDLNVINDDKWWKLRLIKPSSSETINGTDQWDKIIKMLILLAGVLGIAAIIYFAFFLKDIEFSAIGVALIITSVFGLKKQQQVRTIELNEGVAY